MRHERLTLIVAFAGMGLAGCNRQPPAAGGAAPAAAPVVTVVKPEKRPVKRVVEQPGAVQAFEETVLYAKIPGYVQALMIDPHKADRPEYDRFIDIGSRVKVNQVLAELAVPELEQEFQQKEALARQAGAEVTQAKKALTAAGAGVTAAKARVHEAKAALTRTQALYDRWQSEVERVNRLVASGVIDTQTRDETLNQFKAAEANRAESVAKIASADAAVTKAEADRDKSIADVTAIEARLDVAKADVRRVDALRGYLKIKAPYDGVVTRRAVNTGDLVTGDGKLGLFAVARLDPVRVVVTVPESDAGLVAVGQVMQIAVEAVPGLLPPGKVVRTSWSLDPSSRTLRTEVDLPNPEGKVRPGMYVSARLTVEMPAEWSLPSAAIGKVGDETVVYLIENGKAVRVPVQLLRGDSQFTQVRRYKMPGANDWTAFTGTDAVATPAAAVTNGQAIQAR